MARAFTWIVVAYAAALAVALAVGGSVPFEHPIAVALLADVAATVVVFAFSYAFRNSSFYDAYWSVAPIAIAFYWLLRPVGDPVVLRQVLVMLMVVAWGVRLTANWARGWQGLSHEDWRYVDLQQQHGSRYWLVSFGGIHMLPTLWVFAGCLSLFPALSAGGRPFNKFDALALLVTGLSVGIEHVADEQLRAFRRSQPPAGSVLSTGIWSWSRHPNYFGEMGFWWGLWRFGVAADPSWWWTVVGPLSITLLFVFVSLPMIETRMLERRPEAFSEYVARTSLVVPLPPRH